LPGDRAEGIVWCVADVVALASSVPAEGNGLGVALGMLLVGVGFAAVLVPLAYLIGRDAARHGREPWLWGVLFVFQPVVVGLVYLVVRRRPPRGPRPIPPGWYPSPDPTGTPQLRWWDGSGWSAQVREQV
jgi:hypothetical protein